MDKAKALATKFWKEFGGSIKELEQAAYVLADKPDAEAAMKKVLPALDQKVIHVFFSYKKKDEEAARKIIGVLKENSNKKLEIHSMLDFSREAVGKVWRQRIRESVRQAQWFILLFPDPHDDWDWCLFETGLFEARLTSADRLICLHHPDIRMPGPIEDYQAVPATIPLVEDFLRMIFLENNPVPGMKAIHRSIQADKINSMAREIVQAIRPPKLETFQRFFGPWVKIRIENAANLENQTQLDGATVTFCNDKALLLFDWLDPPQTWGQLRSQIKEVNGDCRWREELLDSIKRIATAAIPHPVQALFTAPSGKMFRPVPFAIDYVGNAKGPIECFHITFTEDVGALDLSAMPKTISMLATVLRFSLRFRWEILDQFANITMTAQDLERMNSAFARMRTDWQSRGVGDQEKIVRLFPPEKSQQVAQIFNDYGTIRNEQGTGELDRAMRDKDLVAIPEILRHIIPISQQFLEIASERFSELVREGS